MNMEYKLIEVAPADKEIYDVVYFSPRNRKQRSIRIGIPNDDSYSSEEKICAVAQVYKKELTKKKGHNYWRDTYKTPCCILKNGRLIAFFSNGWIEV